MSFLFRSVIHTPIAWLVPLSATPALPLKIARGHNFHTHSALLLTIQQAPIATHHTSVSEAELHRRKKLLALVPSPKAATHTLKRQYSPSLYSIPKAVRACVGKGKRFSSNYTGDDVSLLRPVALCRFVHIMAASYQGHKALIRCVSPPKITVATSIHSPLFMILRDNFVATITPDLSITITFRHGMLSPRNTAILVPRIYFRRRVEKGN